MSTPKLYVVTVSMADGGSHSDLLPMASVLHRRGVRVVEADFSRPSGGRRIFSATFSAHPQQAETVLRTFEGVIDVVDACLFEALDTRAVPQLSNQ